MLPKVKKMEEEKKLARELAKDPNYVPVVVPPKPKRGRPSNQKLRETKKIGRPKETEGRIAEFKARLLGTSGTTVIDTILKIAQDDKHPNQVACLKMCIDRMLPLSIFEKGAGQKNAVQINIINTTVDQEPTTTVDIDVQEVDS